MKKIINFTNFIFLLLLTIIANSYVHVSKNPKILLLLIPIYLFINLFAGTFRIKTKNKRLKTCSHGVTLLWIFICSACISVVWHLILIFRLFPDLWSFLWSAISCIISLAIVFWNGIICVYLTSVQLGIKTRVIGALCGMIPIVNVIVLGKIIKTVAKEVQFEAEKEAINFQRNSEQICKTKYPLLLVHGVFFRDSKYINYWGRIPKELEKNGATIFYGNHQSAASVEDSAAELTARIKEIIKETGCEKVNIIAHSKGGLDCRCAINDPAVAELVASLTTINTPHRGCMFADYLLSKIPSGVKNTVATTYNSTLKKFGDPNPDFLAAVNDLTAASCEEFDHSTEAPVGIFCQSIGSVMPKASGGTFPLNYTYHLVKYFDGPNDGLVSADSFEWGEKYTSLATEGDRGISHGDMVDLNRENIDGFDVREFYVGLVSDLKNRGL